MMNTPTPAELFATVSAFVKGHTTILTYVFLAGIGAFSYFAPAEEFYALEEVVIEHQIKDAARWELLSIKRQLDNYKRKPVDLRESWEIDEIKRLERQEILLEKKINS